MKIFAIVLALALAACDDVPPTDDEPDQGSRLSPNDLIRTLPALQHDEKRLEDIDTEGEDHAGDELRYACMSRPYMRTAPVIEPMRGANEMTMAEAWDLLQPKRSGRMERV
jgi:hypothetical protein